VAAPIPTFILCDNPEKSPNLAMYHVPPEFFLTARQLRE
jgi:hypothetical protein